MQSNLCYCKGFQKPSSMPSKLSGINCVPAPAEDCQLCVRKRGMREKTRHRSALSCSRPSEAVASMLASSSRKPNTRNSLSKRARKPKVYEYMSAIGHDFTWHDNHPSIVMRMPKVRINQNTKPRKTMTTPRGPVNSKVFLIVL